MREMSPFSSRRSEVSIELCSWTMNTVQHRQEPARPLTDRIDYALMRVSHLARYGGKPACTSFEVAITLCRDSHEDTCMTLFSRETANSCMSYAKPGHIAIVHAACIPNTIISRPRSSEVLVSCLTASMLRHMPAVPPLFRYHQLPLGTHVIHNGLVWHTDRKSVV